MRQLSRRAAVGFELLVRPKRSEGRSSGATASFSLSVAKGECRSKGLRAFTQSRLTAGLGLILQWDL
jgi:hypothetical protein